MATVHTEYGPGRIIDQETVRGRTRYKVAGEGFEVWLDQTKVGGYDPHQDDDLDQYSSPGRINDHFRNENLYDPYADDEDLHALRRRLNADEELSEDDPARYSYRTAGENIYEPYEDDPYADEDYDPEDVQALRHRLRLEDDEDRGSYDDTDPAHYSSRQVVRGKAGNHLAWAPLDKDNSTELPYNPDPQHEAVGTPGDDGSSTLQPIHRIDADERLTPADSISFEEGEEDTPGPNPDLFARQAAVPSPNMIRHLTDFLKSKGLNVPGGDELHDMIRRQLEEQARRFTDNERVIKTVGDAGEGGWDGGAAAAPVAAGQYGLNKAIDYLSPGAGYGGVIHSSSVHEAGPEMALIGPALRVLGPMALQSLMGGGNDGGQDGGGVSGKVLDATDPGDYGGIIHDANYRPAGLSDRYIDITAGADYHNDPVAQFRHDPDAYINRIGHLMDEGLNPRFAEYMDLVEADSGIRTAAWKDVRKKAMRLKREGHVTVKDLAPNRIMASVVGDHGTYDVVILKSGSFGGLHEGNPGHSIANWHCGCEWGKWAFRRKFTYVGRLCSHAYASYLTMQSAALKGKPRQQKGPKRKAPSRNMYFPTRNTRHADALQNGPERLTPELVVNDADDAHMFVDVTKDERDDVGPDDVMSEKDIVHFARLMRHCEVTEQPYPRQLVAFLARYADCNDGSDQTRDDWKASDATDANEYLQVLRDDADSKQEDSFGSMAERVHEIQDAVEEARAHGADADRFVASIRTAAPGDVFSGDPVSTDAGAQAVQRAVQRSQQPGRNGLTGADPAPSGLPDPMERFFNNIRGRGWTDSTPDPSGQQAPVTRFDQVNSAEQNYINNPGQFKTDFNKAFGKDAPGNAPGNTPNTPGNAPGGGNQGSGGQGGAKAPTSGPVADGGKAGAENGNNAAITSDSLQDGYYTIGEGDTLTDIAQRAYGDMNKYQDLAKANSNITNVDSLTVGDKIKIDNPIGNSGLSGDVTNPAGGGADGNISTVDSVKTDALDTKSGLDAPAEGGNAGLSVGMPSTQTDTPTPAAPKTTTNEVKASRAQTAATGTGGAEDTTATDNAADATTPATPATPATPSPGAKPATNPATDTAAGSGQAKQTGPDESETYDPNNPADLAAQNSSAGNPGNTGLGSPNAVPQTSTGGGFGMGGVGDALSTGIGVAGDVASGIGSALPNIADAVSSVASGIGSIFASKQDFDDWVRYAYPTVEGEGELLPHTHPFAGSGYPGPLEIGTSEEYADKARAKADDVTDLGDDPLSTPMGKWQRQSAHEVVYPVRAINGDGSYDDCPAPQSTDGPQPHEILADGTCIHCYDKPFADDNDETDPYREASIGYSTDDDSDIVRTFQAHLGETALGEGAGSGAGRFDDIAGAAQGFLRTAGRNYSLAEQSELIREGDKGGAGNLHSLDLRGTHYEDMDSLGW